MASAMRADGACRQRRSISRQSIGPGPCGTWLYDLDSRMGEFLQKGWIAHARRQQDHARVWMAEDALERPAAQQVAHDHARLHRKQNGRHGWSSRVAYTRSWLAASRFARHIESS